MLPSVQEQLSQLRMDTTSYISLTGGLSTNAVLLAASLFLGYPLAIIYRLFFYGKEPQLQYLFFTGTGLGLFILNYGFNAIHSVIALLLAYLICRYFGGKVVSVWLAYLVFMSYLYIGYVMTDNGTYDLEWTVPHCVLTLRLIGFVFDMYDNAMAKKSDKNHSSAKIWTRHPHLLEMAAYMYFYGGCLVGPQFSFERFQKFVHGEYSDPVTGGPPKSVCFTLLRLFQGIGYMLAHIFFYPRLPTEFFLSEEFKDWNMGWKLVHLLLWFRVIVFRYQAVWLVAEGSCILSGIAHNLDLKTGEQLWDGVRNIRLTKFEFCASFQSMIESFNYNTNQWAAKYVFKKLKFLGNKILSHVITLLFLALWHGTYSGYFACFALEFVCVMSERQAVAFIERHPKLKEVLYSRYLFLPVWFVKKMIVLLSCAYGFLAFDLLTFERWWQVYINFYFIGWIAYAVFWLSLVIASSVAVRPSSKPKVS